MSDLRKTFKDEVYGKKKCRSDQKHMLCWNKEMKDITARKKEAFDELCRFPSEDNNAQYKCKRNQTRKIVAKAM